MIDRDAQKPNADRGVPVFSVCLPVCLRLSIHIISSLFLSLFHSTHTPLMAYTCISLALYNTAPLSQSLVLYAYSTSASRETHRQAGSHRHTYRENVHLANSCAYNMGVIWWFPGSNPK